MTVADSDNFGDVKMYFVAADSTNGWELWVRTPTARPPNHAFFSFLSFSALSARPTILLSFLLFCASVQETDGTEAGTKISVNLAVNATSAFSSTSSIIPKLRVAGGKKKKKKEREPFLSPNT